MGYIVVEHEIDEKRIDRALALIRAELVRASKKNGPFNSSHEGAAIIQEEWDEFWYEVKHGTRVNAQTEVTQLGAMAARWLVDLGGLYGV